ncbi:Hint domain-containing protein [Limimaricola cinnabarinus]|uniref:Hint domain-containing protein n=1 Tax=Limimaricola cinnabarinus TaxID=1125964 RepID=UPI00249113B2|nr:Hint domain-containing protein [Limimaricola cinnabarinus]
MTGRQVDYDSETQQLAVFDATDLRVAQGVAQGDPLSFADELVPDDLYRVEAAGPARRLKLRAMPGGTFQVVSGAADGRAGRRLHLDSCLTLMARDGTTSEAIVLVEVEADTAQAVYLLPLGRLERGEDYRLVGIDRHAGTARLAEIACVSFTRGTHIAMASGAQVPVERLAPGDRILTRDDGPQVLRWVGQTTLRATGRFAPVLIREGALHNARDLWLSPDHRIFVWQREDHLRAGRAELMVRVRHLINGDTVIQSEGGFADYFQLVFDDHQIVYAEGIAAESLLVDHRTRGAVPEGIARHATPQHLSYEVSETLLSGSDAVALLRRASGL